MQRKRKRLTRFSLYRKRTLKCSFGYNLQRRGLLPVKHWLVRRISSEAMERVSDTRMESVQKRQTEKVTVEVKPGIGICI